MKMMQSLFWWKNCETYYMEIIPKSALALDFHPQDDD
jgi:hypothetical protein